jgi:predicted nuclease with RNAse H fold
MAVAVTLGIDLSSRPEQTAACTIAWSAGGARIETLALGMTDDRLVTLAKAVGKVGIDVPLGWPRRFAEAVWAHSTGSGWPSDYNHAADNDQMRLRATDRWIARRYQQHALSVAADRLALPAMRAAWLVPRLQVDPVDVSGTGKVVEVYPALALRIWGLPYRRYKGAKGSSTRSALVDALTHRIPWLDFREQQAALERSDDLLDSVVAALIARAHQAGQSEPIPSEFKDDARREGWIAAPRARSLTALLPGAATWSGSKNASSYVGSQPSDP